MLANKDFTFTLNVSTGCYPNKKPEKVGNIQYSTQTLTLAGLEDLQRKGKSFCYNFKETDESGLLTQKQKTKEGFDYTSVIFFDIDKMPVPYDMETYIAQLPYKPSLAYTTLSNGTETEFWKYNYRLIYALDSPARSIEEFDLIYYTIAAANGFKQRTYPDKKNTKYEFDYRQVNQQYYGGGERSQTYRTDYVYSISDFSSFIEEGKILKAQIATNNSKVSKKDNFPNQYNNKRGEAYYSHLEKPFYKDLFSLSPKDFLFKYDAEFIDLYNSAIATHLTISDDGKYWIYPEDYQEVKRNWGTKRELGRDWKVRNENKRCVLRWKIGSGRRKRMYITAQIMKHNVPDITKEELIYCLVRERYYYYENTDNKLNNKELIKIAENALKYNYTLSPCKHSSFSINKEYWLHDNITGNAAKNIVRKEINEEKILSLYDFNLSVKDNLSFLRENGIKVGKSTLYKLKKKYSNNGDFSKPE